VRLFLLIICCGILSRSQQSRKHQLRYFIRAQGFFAQQFFGHGLHRYPIVFDQVSCADVCNSEPSVELLHGSGDEFQQIGSLQEIRVSAEPPPTVKLSEELLTRLADDPASAALLRELGGRPDFNSDMAASRINTFSAIAAMPSFNCSSSVFFAMITSPS
jgi:hypothetical protein